MTTINDVGDGKWRVRAYAWATKYATSVSYSWDKDYEVINEPETMNLTAMMRRALSEDMQTLYKAGYLNGDLKLTEKGVSALNVIMFDAYKDKLVAEAQVELDAENGKTAV